MRLTLIITGIIVFGLVAYAKLSAVNDPANHTNSWQPVGVSSNSFDGSGAPLALRN